MGEVNEVDDYMSDAFLKEDGDIKPGLVNSRTLKRSYELDAKKAKLDDEHRKKHLPISKMEAVKRNEGLSAPIESDNKGFELLAKMGFQPGMGLGKKGSGIAEPVGIEVKKDRIGLGHKTVVEEKLNKLLTTHSEISVEEYRKNLHDRNVEKQVLKDLHLSQRQCRALDLSHGLSQPDEKFFWPDDKKNVTIEDGEEKSSNEVEDDSGLDSDIELTDGDKLKLVTEYLRDTYYFCVWCGTQYSGDIDLSTNCPGETFDSH